MTSTTPTSRSEIANAIEEHRKMLGTIQEMVSNYLQGITDDVLDDVVTSVSSVFELRRATAIQTHLDAAKYSVNAARFYARDAKEEHDAD